MLKISKGIEKVSTPGAKSRTFRETCESLATELLRQKLAETIYSVNFLVVTTGQPAQQNKPLAKALQCTTDLHYTVIFATA